MVLHWWSRSVSGASLGAGFLSLDQSLDRFAGAVALGLFGLDLFDRSGVLDLAERKRVLLVGFPVVSGFYLAAGVGLAFCCGFYGPSLLLGGGAGPPAPFPLLLVGFWFVLLFSALDPKEEISDLGICPSFGPEPQDQASVFLHIHSSALLSLGWSNYSTYYIVCQ